MEEKNEIKTAPAEENKTENLKNITAEDFTAAASEGEIKQEKAAPQESDFENFLKQFPEADAENTVKGVMQSGDYSKGCFTREYVKSLRAEIDALKKENSSEEEITKKALSSGKISAAVVMEYLKSVANAQSGIRPAPSGSSPVLPPSKPKSITEAGALARDIFNDKNV